ncbi:MAG: T9SS type A sorting domain-containing protein [Lewinella sp.]
MNTAYYNEGGYSLPWSNLEDSVELRFYTNDPGTYAEFEICATEQDLRIAEGDGCTAADPVFFDGTGEPGEFIDIRTPTGIVASIENTQPLGEVTVSFFDYDGPEREDAGSGAVYLNRNISIVPENQPTDTLAVRLFLSEADLQSVLDTGVISDDNLLAITKVSSTVCSAAYPGAGEPVIFNYAREYGFGGFIQVEVNSFSEFFIHPANQPLSTGVRDNSNHSLPWTVAPNPITDLVTLTAPPELIDENVRAEVYSTDGRRLLSATLAAGTHRRLSSSAWPSGTYTIVLTSATSRTSLRVVK